MKQWTKISWNETTKKIIRREVRKVKKKTEGKPLIIATNGNITMLFFDGKVYGNGIKEVQFSHNAPDVPVVEVMADNYPVVPMEMETEMFKSYLESIMKNR